MKKEEINKIENLIVKKALFRRCPDFMFNYGDENKKHRDHHRDHADYEEHYLHKDTDNLRHLDDYNKYFDVIKGSPFYDDK